MLKHTPATHLPHIPYAGRKELTTRISEYVHNHVHTDSQVQKTLDLGPNKLTVTEDKVSYFDMSMPAQCIAEALHIYVTWKCYPLPVQILNQSIILLFLMLSPKIYLDCSETAPNTDSQNNRIKCITYHE